MTGDIDFQLTRYTRYNGGLRARYREAFSKALEERLGQLSQEGPITKQEIVRRASNELLRYECGKRVIGGSMTQEQVEGYMIK